MFGWVPVVLRLLGLEASPAAAPVAHPGGVFRRRPDQWPRVLRRRPTTWPRAMARRPEQWVRVWRWRPNMNRMPADTITMTARDRRFLAWDFSQAPEILAGETITGFTVYRDPGPTVGTPALNTVVFDKIPIGQAVVALVSGVTAGGTFDVSCTATTSGGATIEVPGRLVGADTGT